MCFLFSGTQTCTQCLQWGHTSRAEVGNPFHCPAGGAGPDAYQVTVGPLSCRDALFTLSLLTTQPPRYLFVGLPFNLLSPRLSIQPGMLCPQCRIWYLLFAVDGYPFPLICQDFSAKPLYCLMVWLIILDVSLGKQNHSAHYDQLHYWNIRYIGVRRACLPCFLMLYRAMSEPLCINLSYSCDSVSFLSPLLFFYLLS